MHGTQAWIITLNSHLADEIRESVHGHHEHGPLFRAIRTTRGDGVHAAFQELIERRVQVFDIEHIMEALARALGFDSPRILTDAVLQRIFLKEIIGQRAVMKNIPNASSALLWSRALRDFKNGMFDDLNGGMRSGNEYIAFTKKRIRSTHDSLLSHGEEIMRSWHRCIKKAIDDGYLPPQEISGKLFLEMQGPAGFGYLDTVAQRIENDLGTPLPESILLDELQDLSVGEVVSLLLLTRIGSDEANRIILVGD